MHQDPQTGVLIPDLTDIVSPGHPRFTETGDPADWTFVDPDDDFDADVTVELPVPPPAHPADHRWWAVPLACAVLGLLLVAALETFAPGVIGTAVVCAVAVAAVRLRRRFHTDPPPPPEGDPAMFRSFRAGQPLDLTGEREYEIRVYDGTYRVLRGDRITVRVDLGGTLADGILARQLQRLAEEAVLRNHAVMQRPRLSIHDADTGVRIKYWTGA